MALRVLADPDREHIVEDAFLADNGHFDGHKISENAQQRHLERLQQLAGSVLLLAGVRRLVFLVGVLVEAQLLGLRILEELDGDVFSELLVRLVEI